jgi:hypothetical protein
MSGSRGSDDVQAVSWFEDLDALERRVAEMKAAGASREERAAETEEERGRVLGARSAAFAKATQGRGKPLSKQTHGDGKRAEEK